LSRGLGKVERKILKGLKEYEKYCKENGSDRAEAIWKLAHYIEGNCETLYDDIKPDEYVKPKHIGEKRVPGKWVAGEWQMPGWTGGKFIKGYCIHTEFSHSTYIKTYNAVKSLERKGYVETQTENLSFGNWPRTRMLLIKLKH